MYSVNEEAGTVTVQVGVISGSLTSDVNVQITSIDGSATSSGNSLTALITKTLLTTKIIDFL